MAKYIKYIGASELLGEVASDGGLYWMVYLFQDVEGSRTKKIIDTSRVVAIPKWSTQIIIKEDLAT